MDVMSESSGRSKSSLIGLLLLGGVALVAMFLILLQSRGEETAVTPTTAVSGGALPTAIPIMSTVADRPTTSPQNTATPSPPTAVTCQYDASLVADVTVPDDTIMQPGQPFVKTWRVRNTGNCDWAEGTAVVFETGDQMEGPDAVPVSVITPGETVDISIPMTAPLEGGTYSGVWKLRMANGALLDRLLVVRILVPIPTDTAVPPTMTPVPTGTPPIPTVTAVPATPVPPPIVVTGWLGEYFNNTSLNGPSVLVRDDPEINFNWGVGTPSNQVQPDNFSVRWTRSIPFSAGAYTFRVDSDDGVRFWLDGQLIIDEWHIGAGQYEATLTLLDGSHDLRVEYFDGSGLASIRVWWQIASSSTPVPPNVAEADWLGQYYTNPDLLGSPQLIRRDPIIHFDWGTGAPAAGMPSNNFSVLWTRNVQFTQGNYIFTVTVDDGMRLYIDDQLIIDEWQDGSRRTVETRYWLSAGVHSVRVEYYERLANATIQVSWRQ